MTGQRHGTQRHTALHTRRRCAGRAGFTLIELTLVVAILAVITAASLPTFSRFQRKAALSAEGSKLVQTLRYAQQRSVLERQPIQVVFDLKKKAYWIPTWDEQVRRQQGRVRKPRKIKELKSFRWKIKNDHDIELFYYPLLDREVKKDETAIQFYPDGTADTVYITLVKVNAEWDKEIRIFIKTVGTTGQIKSYVAQDELEGWDFYDGRFDEKDEMS
ncbi:MAG: GspH/FimT family pseudopilin [bacterium]